MDLEPINWIGLPLGLSRTYLEPSSRIVKAYVTWANHNPYPLNLKFY